MSLRSRFVWLVFALALPISNLLHLLIEWVESGVPPVTPPERQGFGSRLLQRGLALESEAI
ncbi:hypothetical protein GR304_23535 [Microvirga sp. SYSU G3D207]|uniref:Uncharacterized protein n=1 Tax=Microvirga arsenatis TaxID=2692265 RepID=A0ABW9Z481_9HYPH|nr:hypothetical protein [Microvirga arsenatis]NBJ13833.1 hypothetical protein [Microvirga arsenatis]NBJ27275.1 hypothetical protein [Microvirga arsenatis]